MGTAGAYLSANLSNLEAGSFGVELQATGFKVMSNNTDLNSSGQDYIYMAIRRPNKPAEEFDPEELFAINSLNGDGQFESGFPVDFSLQRNAVSRAQDNWTMARLAQGKRTKTNDSAAEGNEGNAVFDYQDRWYKTSAPSNTDNMSWMWRRAPGFFDVVCYEGTGSPNNGYRDVPHSLGVVPEMIWIKRRDSTSAWVVNHKDYGAGYVNLDNVWNDYPVGGFNHADAFTATTFSSKATDEWNFNAPGGSYIAYLFASVPGISKVGSYTGNGGNANIDCGFTNGARFVLIKRTDATGDWWFTVDPNNPSTLAKLNSTDAASDQGVSIYAFAGGFGVSQTSSTNLCEAGAEYIFYAVSA